MGDIDIMGGNVRMLLRMKKLGNTDEAEVKIS